MRRRLMLRGLLVISLSPLLLPDTVCALATSEDARVRAQLAGLRVPFIANEGQVDGRVAYYAPTFAGTLFVTRRGELVYSLPGRTADPRRDAPRRPPSPGWTLTEAVRNGRPRPVGQDRSATGVSSFIGNDPTRWRAQAGTYEQVSLGEVWPGVTVAVQARGRNVEKVFTVRTGASVNRIRVRVGGARALAVDAQGGLIARTDRGPVTFTAPIAYQERDGVRREIPVAYRSNGREYGFSVGVYDRTLPLVIDPLVQSTYLGGSDDDRAFAIAIAPMSGDVYVTGRTQSIDFPGTAGGAQVAIGRGSSVDAFVARLDSSLTSLTQATYLGGRDYSEAFALAIHPTTGDVYVAGRTFSADFPGTAGGAQPAYAGEGDAFVVRLASSLTLLIQATYLGGSGSIFGLGIGDVAYALAIAPTTGDVYVAGLTLSADFPGTAGGAQPSHGGGISGFDAFIARLPASLRSITQATYLGGIGDDVAHALAISPTTGDVYVAGYTDSFNFPDTAGGAQPVSGGSRDAFVVRLPPSLTSLTQATYLGGGSIDEAYALAIAPTTGDVYVAGRTSFSSFPGGIFPGITGGAQPVYGGGIWDGFVARLPGSLTSLTQATYLGGSDIDEAYALAIAPVTSDVYVAGHTSSTNFPGIAGGVQRSHGGGFWDIFVARFPSSLTRLSQSTYVGGDNDDSAFGLAIAPTTGDVYVAGSTGSPDFPGPAGGAQPTINGFDAFVARLTFGLAQVDPHLGLSVLLNRSNFSIGDTLTATVGLTNPGLPRAADFYVGWLFPDGDTILFFTSAGGTTIGRLTDLTSFRPIAAGVSLGTPFEVSLPNVLSHQRTGAEPHGGYVFFLAAVKAGALAAGNVTGDEVLAVATALFSFP